MDLSSLAAKQKRIQSWREFLSITDVAPELREKISNALELLGKVLVDCWKSGSVSPDATAQMAHLERELEILNERVRLAAPETLSRDLEK